MHEGPYFKVDAIHLCEPSPQRTPVLYQAGASTRGRQFAADHAECVFINGPSKKVIGGIVADIRRRAAAAGRDPRDLVIFTMMTVITDQTREAALEKFRDYQRYVSPDGALTLMSGWTGVDFSALPKHEPVRFQAANAMTSALEAFTTADPDRAWTVDEIARHAGIGGRGPVIVGSYQDVADEFADLGARNRCRRLQSRLCGDAGDICRHRRSGGAGIAAPRAVQNRVRAGYVTGETVRPRTGTIAGEPSGGAGSVTEMKETP